MASVLDAEQGRRRLLARVLLFEDATGSWGFCMFLGRQRLLAHTLLFEDAIGSCRTFLEGGCLRLLGHLTSPMLWCTSPCSWQSHTMPCFKLYRLHKESWRRAVATWYKLKEQDSKKELLRACFGCTYARRVDGELLACPLLEGLAVESQRLQARLCEQSPGLSKCMQESGKPRPSGSLCACCCLRMPLAPGAFVCFQDARGS